MSNKKLKLSTELTFVIGIIIMPLAVSISTKANLGLSMIAAPSYIISEKIPLTYGQTEYFFQAFILVLMCIAVKKFKWSYLTSFATAVIYGTILDLFIWLMKDWQVEQMWLRVILFIIGMLLTAVGVALFMNTYLAPCAYDYFVRTVVNEYTLDLRKFKLCNDFAYLVLSIALTLILHHGFIGITWGTIVIAVCNGNLISFINNKMNKHIEFYDRFPKLSKYF